MDTRTLGYIGLGVLVGIVVATLIGIPPVIWMAALIVATIVAVAAMVAVVVGRSEGVEDAARMLALETAEPEVAADPTAEAPRNSSSVEMELVRPPDSVTDTPAVWLHRRGGRRVHRYQTDGLWNVERVSTKDPDNPKKRVIGETLTFASEADAISAADELAQGQAPGAAFPKRPNFAAAEA